MRRGEKDAKRSSVVRRSSSGHCPSCGESAHWIQTTWTEVHELEDGGQPGDRDEISLSWWWCASGHSAFVRERGPSGRTGEWVRELVQAAEVTEDTRWHSSDDDDSELNG